MPTADSFVTYSQPMSRMHTASFEAHSYVEGPSQVNPGDVNIEGFDEAHSGVIFELGNLPWGSVVRYNLGKSAGSSLCAAVPSWSPEFNGERIFIDIWVRPGLDGQLRTEKYLGYVICQHLEGVVEGEREVVASEQGFIAVPVAMVWAPEKIGGWYPRKAREDGSRLCWTGPHVHTYASRDAALEGSSGTYTTGIAQKYAAGESGSGLGVGSEIYRWDVTWTW